MNGIEHEHWRVDLDGAIADPFRTLTDVFISSPEHFLERVVAAHNGGRADGSYAQSMLQAAGSIPAITSEHGELSAVGALMQRLPHGAHSTSPTARRFGWRSFTRWMIRSRSSATAV